MQKVIQLNSANLHHLHALRSQVLRPGLPIEASYYPEDTQDETLHLAIGDNQEQLSAIATFIEQKSPLFAQQQQYRLRGMATAELKRRQGLGSRLLLAAFLILKGRNIELIWCNARVNALSFYKYHGFKIIGEEFDIPGIGPHFIMKKLL